MKSMLAILIGSMCFTTFAISGDSMGDFIEKAKDGKPLTVVFFGGSLTWGANASDPNRTSYRARISQMLQENYPQARWKFIDAAIGGTGSQLGIYRVDRDVLAYHPDLVLLDFTLNDNALTNGDDRNASYEAIVRRILQNGKCPILAVFLASKEYVTLPDIETLKRRTAHIELCKYYGVPYADVITGMRDDYRAGTLDLDKVWPPELFDMTHPHDYGYKVYADHVWKALIQSSANSQPFQIPDKWLAKNTYDKIARFRLAEMQNLPNGWRVGFPETRAGTYDFLCSRWQDREVIAANCIRKGTSQFGPTDINPDELTVKFYGTTVMLFGEATIWSGKYQVLIDGKDRGTYDDTNWAKTFSPSAFLVKPIASDLSQEQPHTLIIKPLFTKEFPQMLKLESICIAGPERAEIVP